MSFFKILMAVFLLNSIMYASEESPTQEEVAKLYVATFNRAPDSDGLEYWTETSGLSLSKIAQSFFDQEETKTLYPEGTSNRDFIKSVYQNLFNRTPDDAGWDYWEQELSSGAYSKNLFIQTVINGAQDSATSNDASILKNKQDIGLSFANAGLSNVDAAKSIMEGITDDLSTVTAMLSSFGISLYTEKEEPVNDSNSNVKAVSGLSNAWSQNVVYNADILYPKGIFKDDEQNVYLYSSTDTKTNIAKLTTSNTLELTTSFNSSVQALGFQSGKKSFIYTTMITGLYSADMNGNVTSLKSFGVYGNKIAVASDDSFYTCSGSNMFGVYHYDSSGNLLDTLVDNVNVCSSVVLNNDETKLYFTSSMDGTVSEIDLATKTNSVIGTNMGIPGTTEPITLGFDGDNALYAFSGAEAIYKYSGGKFQKAITSMSGAGDMVWSSKHNSFLVGVGASANIVAYSTQTNEGTNLTEYLNAFKIAEDASGNVFTCNNDTTLSKVTSSGFQNYLSLDSTCSALNTDNVGKIYIGLSNGKILTLDSASKDVETWANYTSQNVIQLSFDSYNQSFIAFHQNDVNVEVWKVPVSEPQSATKIYTLSNVLIAPTIPSLTTDDNGNAYILERGANKVYKLNINTAKLSTLYSSPLSSDAITVPDMVYSSNENSLIISTINEYLKLSLDTLSLTTFAVNNGSVDNFAMHVNEDGKITAIHSGQVFQMTPSK